MVTPPPGKLPKLIRSFDMPQMAGFYHRSQTLPRNPADYRAR